MSNITNVQNQQPVMQNQQVQNADNAAAPAALQNAKPNVGAVVCRVLAGIFSLGITEGIFAICRHIEKNAVQAARGAAEALPAAAPSIAEQNAALSAQFKNDTLPPELKAAVSEAFSELRASYGENVLSEAATVREFRANAAVKGGFSEKTVISDVANAIKNSETELSPQDLKNCILEKASPKLAMLAARAFILEQSPNISSDFASMAANELLKTAGFTEKLAACKNAEEVKTCLLDHSKFTETVEYFTGRSECEEKATQHIFDELAKLTGKSQQEIQERVDLVELTNKIAYASKDTESKGTVQERLEQLNAKIPDIAEKFIQTKTDLYTSVGALTVSEGLKEHLQNDVLGQSTLNKGYVFSRAENVANQVNVSSLIRVLQEGNAVSDLDLTGVVKAVSIQISDAINTQYSQKEINELGGDGSAVTVSAACQILLDKNPELVALLKQEPGKLDRLMDMLTEQKYAVDDQLGAEAGDGTEATRLHGTAIFISKLILSTAQDIAETNSSIVSSLQSGEGAFAQSMQDTLAAVNEEYGVNIGANLNELAALPFGKEVIKNIESRITPQNQRLSSAQFTEIVRSELQTHVANLAVKTAISERCAELGLNTERLGSMLASLKKLYPALQESINRADSKEEIQALLLSCDKYENILRRESDIAVFSEQSRQDVLARLAPLLNVDAEDVPATMNLDKLREGFLIAAKDIHDEGNASEDGSVADIQGRFQRIADRFVKGKSDLIAFVNNPGLAISPELRAKWRDEINTNISLKNPVLLHGSYNAAQSMDGSALMRGVREGLNQTELLGLVKSLSAQIDEYAHQVFTPEQFNDMGSDETSLISRYTREAFWERNGELKTLLAGNSAVFQEISSILENEFSTLVSQLAKSDLQSPESIKIRQDMAFVINAQALLSDVFGNQE